METSRRCDVELVEKLSFVGFRVKGLGFSCNTLPAGETLLAWPRGASKAAGYCATALA